MGNLIHFLGQRYILPPITSDLGNATPHEALVKYLKKFFQHQTVLGNPPTEIIIPFNPGGHWVTIRIDMLQNRIDYIDSLSHEIPEINTLREEHIRGNLITLQEFLGQFFGGRNFNINIFYGQIQPDSVSCGVLTFENIRNIIEGRNAFSSNPQGFINHADIQFLRDQHQQLLADNGFNFDMDFLAPNGSSFSSTAPLLTSVPTVSPTESSLQTVGTVVAMLSLIMSQSQMPKK